MSFHNMYIIILFTIKLNYSFEKLKECILKLHYDEFLEDYWWSINDFAIQAPIQNDQFDFTKTIAKDKYLRNINHFNEVNKYVKRFNKLQYLK